MNTPRTDHAEDLLCVDADFARQLERELTAARKEIEELRGLLADALAALNKEKTC